MLKKIGDLAIVKKLTIAMPIFIMLICIALTAQARSTEPAEIQRDKLIETCRSFLGTPYVYGGLSAKGMDCSGFIYISAKTALRMELPRRSEDIYGKADSIKDEEIQPGDLLFFQVGTRINHVAVYLGNGEFIHSVSDGPKTGVVISTMQESYWQRTYRGAGRILPVANAEYVASKDAIPLMSTMPQEENLDASTKSDVALGTDGANNATNNANAQKSTNNVPVFSASQIITQDASASTSASATNANASATSANANNQERLAKEIASMQKKPHTGAGFVPLASTIPGEEQTSRAVSILRPKNSVAGTSSAKTGASNTGTTKSAGTNAPKSVNNTKTTNNAVDVNGKQDTSNKNEIDFLSVQEEHSTDGALDVTIIVDN